VIRPRRSGARPNETARKGFSPSYDHRRLVTYRLLVLSNTLGKGAVRFYARQFHIPLPQWRLIAVLALHAPISVNALSVELSTDKGWISRTASALIRKGLVESRIDAADSRKLLLDLTAKGRGLYARVAPAVSKRQRQLLSVLSEPQRKVFEAALDKLQQRATQMLVEPEADWLKGAASGHKRRSRR
jgi:DNA-binding MarR family transcriptional regulator